MSQRRALSVRAGLAMAAFVAVVIALVISGCAKEETLNQAFISAFSSEDAVQELKRDNGVYERLRSGEVSAEEVRDTLSDDEVMRSFADCVTSDLDERNYPNLGKLLDFCREESRYLQIPALEALYESGLDQIRQYVEEHFRQMPPKKALSEYQGLQDALMFDVDMEKAGILMPQELAADGLIVEAWTELYEGMPGYYDDTANREDNDYNDETLTYEEGWESALRTLHVKTVWTYYGDYALKDWTTAKDDLQGGFTYTTTYQLFFKGEYLGNLSSDWVLQDEETATLNGMRIGGGYYWGAGGNLCRRNGNNFDLVVMTTPLDNARKQ